MEPDEGWRGVRDALGRDPTDIEEELSIDLIRTGHVHTVEAAVFEARPFTCPIGEASAAQVRLGLPSTEIGGR